MYVYTVTFAENVVVEKARQALLLFLEVFYDSTKTMICTAGGDRESELLFLSDDAESPRHTLVETGISIHEDKMQQLIDIVNTILKMYIIEKIKVSFVFRTDDY